MKYPLNPFRVLLLTFLVTSTSIVSQTREEYTWALIHPIVALKVNKMKHAIDTVYDRYVKLALPDSFDRGGKLDAFRHVFYMSVFTQKSRVKAVRKLGKAHERANLRNFKKNKEELGDLADEIFSEMDLINNEVGFLIGPAHKKASTQAIVELVLQAIADGKAKIVLRNCQGSYVGCEQLSPVSSGVRIAPSNKKCLVPSNQNCVQ
jgi:hypothetical protein